MRPLLEDKLRGKWIKEVVAKLDTQTTSHEMKTKLRRSSDKLHTTNIDKNNVFVNLCYFLAQKELWDSVVHIRLRKPIELNK